MSATQPDPGQVAWRAVVETQAEVLGRLTEELREETGMAMTWYDVLLHLSDVPDGRMRVSELARAVIVSKSGLTTIVDGLEEAGLVRREVPPADRRAIEVALTAAGRRRFAAARRVHRRGIDRLFCAHLSEAEARVIA